MNIDSINGAGCEDHNIPEDYIDEDLIRGCKCEKCGAQVCKDEYFGGLCIDCAEEKK